MAEATLHKYPADSLDYTPVAAVTAGEVIHLPDGRAGFAPTAIAAAALGAIQVKGIVTVAKTASVVMLVGQPVYWDHSASSATYTPASDEDFFLGVVHGADAASADMTLKVDLNVRPNTRSTSIVGAKKTLAQPRSF